MKDTSQCLQQCFSKLHGGNCSQDMTERIWLAVAHLCFRQFRADVMYALREELRSSEEKERAEADEIPLCYDTIREVFVGQPNLVSGNKARVKTPADMMEWIWGDSGSYNRTFFVSKPFRMMYEKACTCIGSQGAEAVSFWRLFFQDQFLMYHWILPYPDTNGTLISTTKKGGSRQWWAVKWEASQGYTWGRKKARQGRPTSYPKVLDMEEQEFLQYLDGNSTM